MGINSDTLRAADIPGEYTRAGAYLQRDGLTLIIGTRQATPTKPKHYLLAKDKGKGKAPDAWISSLYPVPGCERIYSFDYAKVRYVLEFESCEIQARIRKAPSGA